MSLFSTYWYRVEELKPRLRAHAKIHRHHYRGQRWHVIEDPAAGRYHRFGPETYYVIALMDGSRTVSEIWNASLTHLGDDAPGQNELIMLLAQLHAADLLQSDVTPDTAEVFDRFGKAQRQQLLSKLLNPMFARVPVWDPDEWLGRWVGIAEHVFRPWVFVAWLLLMAYTGLQAGIHWDALTAPGLASMLEPMNLLILCLAYPLVKILHELGHAFATRVFGGEVHEVGVMFLILVPMPYVDASSSSSFGNKWRRITVAAAGVMVELFLSAIALLLWLEMAPGFVRSVLWNIVMIGGLSTLLFNGNPLLRFDGYYVLSDLIEIPNLAGRSDQYLRYLIEHYLLGLPERRAMTLAPGERPWLVGYGVLSRIYRVSVTLGIALFLATRFFFLGVLLALWGILLQLVLPAIRGIANLRADPRVQAAWLRVVGTLAGAALALFLAIFVVPFPSWSIREGVVWIPERAQLRAGTDGFVRGLAVARDADLAIGDTVIETSDPVLDARVRVLEASLDEARAVLARDRQSSIAEARIQQEEVARLRGELDSALAEQAQGAIRAGVAGRFVLVDGDVEERFVRRGEVLGYVAHLTEPTIRAVVGQDDVARLQDRLRSIEVRLAEAPNAKLPATIDHVVPTATNQLPSRALGVAGGGRLAVDTRDPDGLTATEPFFLVDLALANEVPIHGFGGRVLVRFEFEPEPLYWRAHRSIRRLFMGELGV